MLALAGLAALPGAAAAQVPSPTRPRYYQRGTKSRVVRFAGAGGAMLEGTLLLPVWMVVLLPMFVWFNIVREPNSALATAISMFPPSTPMVMTLRMATGATIPLWQSLLSLVMTVCGTWLGVLAAARIYRQGILRQGKPPRMTEMLMWIFRRPDGSPVRQTEPRP